jgi:hypothetical protein
MEGHPAEHALSRIESALARIEAAAARLDAKGGDLPARHEALRGAVGDALKQLDTLIGGGKGGAR